MEKITNKIIHYCWFGGAPLSELTKKCIETWKKFLPDFEIKEWNEKNFDLEQCTFVKEAYEQKKWAFVADYTRFKVLEEYGGIYLDTDMEITADISKYLNDDLFFGTEDSKMINAAVVWVKNKNDKHIKNIVDIYEKLEHFNPTGDLYDMSVPRVLTTYFEGLGFDKEKYEIQNLDNNSVTIYPMEYFYPLSYDYQHNKFTDNSCMIHHFDATWISKMEKFKTKMKRKNMTWVVYVIDFFVSLKNKIKFFCNYRDLTIFASMFLIMLFSVLSLTPINNEGSTFSFLINSRLSSILQILAFSFIWTFVCAKIRMIDLNKFGDKLLGRDLDSEEYKPLKLSIDEQNKMDKFELLIYVGQLILTVIISFIPIVQLAIIIPNSFSIFLVLVVLNSYLVYCGVKRKFKYRILELVPYALILALIYVLQPSIGILISVCTFAFVLINLIKYNIKSKRIKTFAISYVTFMVAATILSVFVFENFTNIEAGTNLIKNETFNNYTTYSSEEDVITEFNAAKVIFANNIKNIVNTKVLFNATTYAAVSVLLSIICSIIAKNYRYVFIGVLAIINTIYLMGSNVEIMFILNVMLALYTILYLLELFLDNVINERK